MSNFRALVDVLIGLGRLFFLRKKLWLLPILFSIVLIGAILLLAQGSVLAPFIYTLF